MSYENDLLLRAAVAQRDQEAAKKKEDEASIEHIRVRTLNQLKAHGKDVSNEVRRDETVKFNFSNYVKVQLGDESIEVHFELGANDVDLDRATGISINIPVLNEKLLLTRNKAADRAIGSYSEMYDEPTKGEIVTTIPKGNSTADVLKVKATYSTLQRYIGLLNQIDDRFPLPQSTAGKSEGVVASNTP